LAQKFTFDLEILSFKLILHANSCYTLSFFKTLK